MRKDVLLGLGTGITIDMVIYTKCKRRDTQKDLQKALSTMDELSKVTTNYKELQSILDDYIIDRKKLFDMPEYFAKALTEHEYDLIRTKKYLGFDKDLFGKFIDSKIFVDGYIPAIQKLREDNPQNIIQRLNEIRRDIDMNNYLLYLTDEESQLLNKYIDAVIKEHDEMIMVRNGGEKHV